MVQVITIVDTQASAISGVPTNPVIQGNDPGACGAIIEYPLFSAVDNCSQEVILDAEPASGSFFPVGTTSVNVTATDECNNVTTLSFDVVITN